MTAITEKSRSGASSFVTTAWSRPFVRGIALWLGLIAVAYATSRIGTPYWLTNDDATMSQLASGEFSGRPTGQLIFVSTLLGEPLALLYTLIPALDWYAWGLVVSVSAAFAALSTVLRPRLALSWAVFAATIMIWTTLRPNFTVTAIAVASVGVLLSSNAMRSGRFSIGGLILFALGIAWRADAGVLSVLISIPLLVPAIQAIRLQSRRWPSIAMASALPVTVLVMSRVHSWCLSGRDCQAWQDFSAYNAIRGTFHTAPRGDALSASGDVSGVWSDAATTLFLNFAYPDDTLFDLSNLQQVNTANPYYLQVQGGGLLSHMQYVFTQLSPLLLILLAGLLLFSVPQVLVAMNRKRFIIQIGAVLAAFLIVVTAVSLIRLPFAVAFGSTIATAASLVVSTQWVSVKRYVRPYSLAAVTAMLLGSACLIAWLVSGPTNVRILQSQAESLVSEGEDFRTRLALAAGDTVVFGQGNLADYISRTPFAWRDPSGEPHVLLSGWPVFSPAYQDRKSAMGVSDIYGSLMPDPERAQQPILFAGSATNALTTARILTDRMIGDAVIEASPVAPLTSSQNEFVGEVFLWRFGGP